MKKDNILTSLLGQATLLLVAMAAVVITSCSQDENEPGSAMPDGSKITLVPTVAPDLSWSAGAPGTRADGKIDVALAQGGKIGIMITTVVNDQPGESLGLNFFEVTASGKLIRIPYSGEQDETEDPLSIAAPGEYFVGGAGEINLTTDGITYRSVIRGNGVKVTIGIDGKVTAPMNIDAGGLRLNVKATDGTDYAGADVTATLKSLYQNDNKPFEVKILTADAPSVIWGDICSARSSVQPGNQLLELLVGGKTYRVNAPKQISFLKGRLYTFNVRVGATGITVSSDDLGIADFKTEAETNAEAKKISVWNGTTPTGNAEGSAFSGGDGLTAATAYVIGNAADLAQLAADVNSEHHYTYGGKYFRQTVDIDLDNKTWVPIGADIFSSFGGHYDGKGHAIINLKVDAAHQESGLFGWVKGSNISLKNIHVSGSVDGVASGAGICSWFDGSNSLSASTGDNQVISGCSFTGTVKGSLTNVLSNTGVAGICGYATNAFITSCANYGNITLTLNHIGIGGIVGGGSNCIVAGCYNAGKLSYTGGDDGAINIGGISGSGAKVIGCYNIGTIDLTGINVPSEISVTSANGSDCYAIEPINKSSFAPGVTAFGASWIPASGTWTAGADNDGSYSYSADTFQSSKFWKSRGSWNGGRPVYPKLWWE